MLPRPELGVRHPVARHGLPDQVRKVAIGVWPRHEVHPRDLREQCGAKSLGHAADDPEDGARSGIALQLPDPPKDTLLRVVPDGAGVDQEYIGAVRVVGGDEALTPERAENE